MKPANQIMRRAFLFVVAIISIQQVMAQVILSPDTTFGLGNFNASIRKSEVQTDDKIIVGGEFTYYKTTPLKYLARLNVDGTLDPSFVTSDDIVGHIYNLILQPDGKLLVLGVGKYAGTNTRGIVRLNSDGSLDTGFSLDPAIYLNYSGMAIQPDGKILVIGHLVHNSLFCSSIIRLNADGSRDNSFAISSEFNGGITTILVQPDNKIIFTGNLLTSYNGTPVSSIGRLNSDGTLDSGFNSNFSTRIYASALQSDGKIIVGGQTIDYQGSINKNLARLNTDGTQDNTFLMGTGPSGSVHSIHVLNDDKIVIGGGFEFYNGTSRRGIVKLNADGTLDPSFNTGAGIPGFVFSIAKTSIGKYVVSGFFKSVDNACINHIGMLNEDGSVVRMFNESNGVDNSIFSTIIQPDNKIIISGFFNNYNGIARKSIARLNIDGTLDNSFNPGTGTNNSIYKSQLQPDGKIIIAGIFNSYNGSFFSGGCIRLNEDGSRDMSFVSSFSGAGFDFVIKEDGKIVIVGAFSLSGGNYGIALLNANGTRDNTFIGNANAPVNKIVLQSDGKIIIAGDFTAYNGMPSNGLVRLNSDGSIDGSFVPNLGLIGIGSNIKSMLIQPDGKIVIGGMGGILRFHPNGSSDLFFNTTINLSGTRIYDMAIEDDGKIILAGNVLISAMLYPMARLNVDGSIDSTFLIDENLLTQGDAHDITIQPNGKVILTGLFLNHGGFAFNSIVRMRSAINHNIIQGTIYADANNDCVQQNAEQKHSSVIVKAVPGPYYGGTDGAGKYRIKVDTGSAVYNITQSFNDIHSKIFVNQCDLSHTVTASGSEQVYGLYNFADSIRDCSALHIKVQNTRLRRCFRSNSYVEYCNYGTKVASNVEVKVEYPSYVVPISSVPMWTSKEGQVLTYTIGTFNEGDCGRIVLIDSVICGDESIRGLTQCIKATIGPLSDCEVEDPTWDKSSIRVLGNCIDDSASFTISNVGSGNMISEQNYRLYVNDTLVFTDNFRLNIEEQFIVRYPGEGQTIRLEANQHPLHPGNSLPRATVENCGSSTTDFSPRGLVMTAPLDNQKDEDAIVCSLILDSFDPNDKQTLPLGIGLTNQVEPGQELEYTIRFQNTGTDTAYKVKVIDTIDINLDVASFEEVTSSHPYELAITGKGQAVLTFNFYNIRLPDSTTNKAASNGLVTYKIKIPANAVLGTEIKNEAYIYFDYNSAIITNETMHTVGITVDEDLSKGSRIQIGSITSTTTGIFNNKSSNEIKLYPNPAAGVLTIETPTFGNKMEIKLVSMIGVTQRSISLSNNTKQEISLEGIDNGMYIYELWQDGARMSVGILQVRK